MADHEQCCPKCKGTSGYSYFENVSTGMYAPGWGLNDVPETSGNYGKQMNPSLFTCDDCGAKFNEKTVLRIRGVEND